MFSTLMAHTRSENAPWPRLGHRGRAPRSLRALFRRCVPDEIAGEAVHCLPIGEFVIAMDVDRPAVLARNGAHQIAREESVLCIRLRTTKHGGNLRNPPRPPREVMDIPVRLLPAVRR